MLKQKQICDLIPHDGKMCLLESVNYWDESKIICSSYSHMAADNPLRNQNGLPMLSLLRWLCCKVI